MRSDDKAIAEQEEVVNSQLQESLVWVVTIIFSLLRSVWGCTWGESFYDFIISLCLSWSQFLVVFCFNFTNAALVCVAHVHSVILFKPPYELCIPSLDTDFHVALCYCCHSLFFFLCMQFFLLSEILRRLPVPSLPYICSRRREECSNSLKKKQWDRVSLHMRCFDVVARAVKRLVYFPINSMRVTLSSLSRNRPDGESKKSVHTSSLKIFVARFTLSS